MIFFSHHILGALISLLFQIYPFILILFFQSLLDQPNCVAKIISVRNEKKVLLPIYICFLTKFILLHCKFSPNRCMSLIRKQNMSYSSTKRETKRANYSMKFVKNYMVTLEAPSYRILTSQKFQLWWTRDWLHYWYVQVMFFAERDINPGEEITYDYHFNREDDGQRIPCFCRSKYCRRYLN